MREESTRDETGRERADPPRRKALPRQPSTWAERLTRDIELGEVDIHAPIPVEADPPEPVFVTRPLLPPLNEVIPLLEEIWESRLLTNRGPMNHRLEAALSAHLGVAHPTLVANGTLGLVTALLALDLRPGTEVVTTPFTFVATAHAILTAGLVPVFVDIDPQTYNLDPRNIEAAITERTGAILPVHCFGRACDTDAIEAVASAHDLPVIYDAAHVFGVKYKGRSLLERGRMSVVSFHATKVFNTLEGGCIVANDQALKRKVERLTNYGFESETVVRALGLNAKLNEVSCAFGLAALPRVRAAISGRGRVAQYYRDSLADVPGLRLPPPVVDQTENYAYFPLEITEAHPKSRDQVLEEMHAHNLYARRYFFPVLPDLQAIHRALGDRAEADIPRARAAASRILCLPIYHDMPAPVMRRVVEILRR